MTPWWRSPIWCSPPWLAALVLVNGALVEFARNAELAPFAFYYSTSTLVLCAGLIAGRAALDYMEITL